MSKNNKKAAKAAPVTPAAPAAEVAPEAPAAEVAPEAPAPDAPDAPEAPAAKPEPLVVNHDRGLSCLKGILGPGKPVLPKHIAGDEKARGESYALLMRKKILVTKKAFDAAKE